MPMRGSRFASVTSCHHVGQMKKAKLNTISEDPEETEEDAQRVMAELNNNLAPEQPAGGPSAAAAAATPGSPSPSPSSWQKQCGYDFQQSLPGRMVTALRSGSDISLMAVTL